MESFKKSLGLEKKTTISKISDNFTSTGNKLAAGQVPTFTEESAFSKCCPNLTMKQVKAQNDISNYDKKEKAPMLFNQF